MEQRKPISSFKVTTPEGNSIIYTLEPPSKDSTIIQQQTIPHASSPTFVNNNSNIIATEDENSQDYKSRQKVPMAKGFGMRDYYRIASVQVCLFI